VTETRGRRLASELTSVTIGTSTLGERGGVDALARAIVDSPLGQIDTANGYANGRSEIALGTALRDRPTRTPLIFSKADADPRTGRFDHDRVMASFEETCARLGVSHLPLYFLHDPDSIPFAEAMGPGGAGEALVKLRDEGAVGAIGIAAGTLPMVEEYVRTDVFDAVLNHNRWTLMDRSADGLWTEARSRGMAVLNAAPFGGGILAGSASRGISYGYRPASRRVLRHLERLKSTASLHRVDLAAAALQWAAMDPRVDSVVVGVTSHERLTTLESLSTVPIATEFWDAVASLGSPPPSALD
jgi:D-threo-aldose 1-dehydrogenase